MLYIGIDIGKNYHEASLINSDGKLINKSLRFSNSHEGANKLFKLITCNCTNPDEIAIGLEATGHYWLSLYSFLLNKGYTVHVINPIQSDSFRNFYIRKTKSDSKDSFIIAQIIRFGSFTDTKLPEEKITSLKQLSRHRLYMVDQISDLKRKVITLLDQVFPEYSKLFSDVFGKASKQLLLEHSTPEEIANLDINKIAETLNKASKGRLGYEKAEIIKDTASQSFGIKFGLEAFSFQIKLIIEQINFIEKQVVETEEKINSLFKSFDSHLESIPGIGTVLGAIILSEIGDIKKFKNASSLVAYSGIDPTVKQSGDFKGTKNRMSKRGSPYLRRAIWLAASTAIFNDPVLSKYYEKKKSEGKHHLTAVGAAARKLTYIIYAVLRDQKDYVPMK